jgi:hypothetical protein
MAKEGCGTKGEGLLNTGTAVQTEGINSRESLTMSLSLQRRVPAPSQLHSFQTEIYTFSMLSPMPASTVRRQWARRSRPLIGA